MLCVPMYGSVDIMVVVVGKPSAMCPHVRVSGHDGGGGKAKCYVSQVRVSGHNDGSGSGKARCYVSPGMGQWAWLWWWWWESQVLCVPRYGSVGMMVVVVGKPSAMCPQVWVSGHNDGGGGGKAKCYVSPGTGQWA